MSKNKTVILERRFVPEGTMVMRQGDPGNCAYLIQSGSVSVYTEHGGKRVDLATLDLGQIFGEIALIFDEKRTASVKALEDCNLIIITRQAFKQKLERSDPTVRAIVEMLTRRMVSANNAVIKQKTNTDDLVETSRIIYENIMVGLPASQKKTFESAVLPKLDDFLDALRAFDERFKKK